MTGIELISKEGSPLGVFWTESFLMVVDSFREARFARTLGVLVAASMPSRADRDGTCAID